MWLFLINPLKLCSYGSWSLQGYVCKSSCCQCHIYIYTLAWILKCLKLYPSISLIDDSAAATQPLSRCARVADAATQPLCQSGWSSHSATQPLCQSGRRSHSATQPLCRRGWRSSHSDTQPLSHSAGVAGGAATQPLSHSARVAGAATQPLSHSARVAGAATQPLSHSQPLCRSGWSSHSATQSLCQSGWSSHSATQSLRVTEWLSGCVSHSARVAEWLSGWCENFRHCAFNPILIYKCVCVGGALNQRVSAGGHPSHHWWMANEEASDESCKRTCELLTSDMARWLSHKPPLPTWHGNMITWHDLHDFISSHFILSLRGASKCVFS